MGDVFVWWTSGEDCGRIDRLFASRAMAEDWPRYLIEQYDLRCRDDGPDPVLASDEFGTFTLTWVVGSPAHRMIAGAKGILVRPEDVPLVVVLPGFITDLQMRLLTYVPPQAEALQHTVAV